MYMYVHEKNVSDKKNQLFLLLLLLTVIPGDQEGLFKLAIQLRKFLFITL
jgi:hypothetical protein